MLAEAATSGVRAAFGDDVRLVSLEPNVDARGRLVVLDFSVVPFDVKRCFTVSEVPAGTVRGGHSHRQVEHLLACVSGRLDVELRRGEERHVIELIPESGALYLAAGVWASQRYVTEGTVLIVLASGPFDPDGYENAYR